jgi:hypothetical protein
MVLQNYRRAFIIHSNAFASLSITASILAAWLVSAGEQVTATHWQAGTGPL